MAPSWSSRLLSGTSNTGTVNQSNIAPRNNPSHAKPLPSAPSPRLQDFEAADVSAPPPFPRPRTAGSQPHHTHSRSVSHPLPKLFMKKKSTGNLNRAYNDTNVPLDDTLVPVLDDGNGESSSMGLTRVNTGKRMQDDQEEKVSRRCMCCDSRVKVPKELDKFRCMCCLTINDLTAVQSFGEAAGARNGMEGGDTLRRELPPGVTPPLSIERTRAIIERCLAVYLEARCRRPEERLRERPARMPEHPTQNVTEEPQAMNGFGSKRLASQPPIKQRNGGPSSSSPPITPSFDPALSATITNFADIDQFGFMRSDTPPPPSKSPQPPSIPTSGLKNQPSISRKPVPARQSRKPPPPPMTLAQRSSSNNLRANVASTFTPERSPRLHSSPQMTQEEISERRRYDRVKQIFRPLEDYMLATIGRYETVNAAFSSARPAHVGRTRSESHIKTPPPETMAHEYPMPTSALDGLDPRLLLLGDIGENGTWWTGKLDKDGFDQAFRRRKPGSGNSKAVTSKSPNIDWSQVDTWYNLVHSAGVDWQRKVKGLREAGSLSIDNLEGPTNTREIEAELDEAKEHAVRALLKVVENLLKRPGKLLREPEDLRFLLIILANPSLYPARTRANTPRRNYTGGSLADSPTQAHSPQRSPQKESGQHSGILKRIFGLLGNSPDVSQRYLVAWLSRFDEEKFVPIVDLCASFITHRLSRRPQRPRSRSQIADGGLIPDLSGGAMNTSAQLHAAMGLGGSVKKRADDVDSETDWANDWQIKAGAKAMSLLFAANNIWRGKRVDEGVDDTFPRVDSGLSDKVVRPQDKARRSGQLLHTSSFYNTLLDYHDLIADFKVWESRKEKFAFCQFPLFLSMGAKIKILEYDARRQMEIKAREAYFDQVIRQRAIDGHFHLRVRRECMVDDSLRQISAAVGSGQEEVKKGLRVHFAGEEGVDAGGPRKEWFLMLVREVFDADHGLFVYDDDSRTCYFNPNTFETSDQYYLVGALLGLAIYNSTILDIALPSFAFRKLLAAAPAGTVQAAAANNVANITGTKGQMSYTVADLAEYKPALAIGLQQLLDYDGDVESTYCWNFVAPIDRYGIVNEVPLIPNGENTAVTNANRIEFVDAYIRHLLDTAVARQFEPFKRGFFTVCAGNALSLFRAEEIELLVRGSDETLDVDSLKAVAVYENWRQAKPPHMTVANPGQDEAIVQWFWASFAAAPAEKQRKLLTFITGSDRIPAVGATSLVLRVVAGGDGWSGMDAEGKNESARFPVARTCFNMLVLWRYASRDELERRLWRAVEDSEGFGLK